MAFGNTAPEATRVVNGRLQRGAPSDPAFNPRTGAGYVAPFPGDYARAQKAGVQVDALLVEPSGACGPRLAELLAAPLPELKMPSVHIKPGRGVVVSTCLPRPRFARRRAANKGTDLAVRNYKSSTGRRKTIHRTVYRVREQTTKRSHTSLAHRHAHRAPRPVHEPVAVQPCVQRTPRRIT